jgi:hypothetical protein
MLKNTVLFLATVVISLPAILLLGLLLLPQQTLEETVQTVESLKNLGLPYFCTEKGMGPGVEPILPAFPNCYTLQEMRRHGIIMERRLISQERSQNERHI